MGARVVKLICAYCQKPFKGEHKQKGGCCSYEHDRALRHKDARKRWERIVAANPVPKPNGYHQALYTLLKPSNGRIADSQTS